jgi:hypothetical protein
VNEVGCELDWELFQLPIAISSTLLESRTAAYHLDVIRSERSVNKERDFAGEKIHSPKTAHLRTE